MAGSGVFGLAVYAGLRLGEILALRWEAIDLDALTLRVERSWTPARAST
jgi:integrase